MYDLLREFHDPKNIYIIEAKYTLCFEVACLQIQGKSRRRFVHMSRSKDHWQYSSKSTSNKTSGESHSQVDNPLIWLKLASLAFSSICLKILFKWIGRGLWCMNGESVDFRWLWKQLFFECLLTTIHNCRKRVDSNWFVEQVVQQLQLDY